ncbi:ATP-dependent DNA helicase [Trichonephila clavipes]|nr:ATP-dependent DNA helicase [Trichonephila clavipes]
MPAPNRPAVNIINSDVQREHQFDMTYLAAFVVDNEQLLTAKQQNVYDQINVSIAAGQGGFFFRDAPGCTGKTFLTFLISLILARIRSQNPIALEIASSGIAATLLDSGRTAHSVLKVPLNVHTNPDAMCNMKKHSGMAEVLRKCKIILWDECTMVHKHSLEALDRTLKDIKDNTRLFGGALLLLSGDFRRTFPIIPRATYADEINACLKESYLWRIMSYH